MYRVYPKISTVSASILGWEFKGNGKIGTVYCVYITPFNIKVDLWLWHLCGFLFPQNRNFIVVVFASYNNLQMDAKTIIIIFANNILQLWVTIDLLCYCNHITDLYAGMKDTSMALAPIVVSGVLITQRYNHILLHLYYLVDSWHRIALHCTYSVYEYTHLQCKHRSCIQLCNNAITCVAKHYHHHNNVSILL